MMQNNTTVSENTIYFFVTSWEANGYDDSDGDVLIYDKTTKKIVHHFWTTRGYCPCIAPDAPSWCKGVEAGVITEKEVRDALANDTFPEHIVHFNIRNCYYNMSNLNYPVKFCVKANNKKRNGILLGTIYSSSYDMFGHEIESVHGVIYDPAKNETIKTRLYNVELASETTKMISDNFINNSSIEDICSFISSKNSCSRFSSDWVTKQVVKSSIGLFTAPNIENSTDKAFKQRKPSRSRYDAAKAKVEAKSEQFKKWVETLDETPEKRQEIYNRTMNKYCAKEMDIVKRYEEA